MTPVARFAYWYPAGADMTVDAPIVLHDSAQRNARVMVNHSGWDAPPWETTLTRSPGIDGAVLHDVTLGSRQLTLPVFIRAANRDEVLAWKSMLVQAMNPRNGAGTLLLADGIGEPFGRARYARAVYRDGLRGDGTLEGSDWWRFTVTLDALDPYWYTAEPVTAEWAGQAGAPRFPWSFPWSFSTGGVDVVTPLEISGDAPAQPLWTLTPPFTRVKVTNDRSGEWWQVQRSLDDQWIPLTLSAPPTLVRDDAGVNRYSQLTAGSRLFDLLPGDTVSVQVNGTSAAFRLSLTAGEAWLTL